MADEIEIKIKKATMLKDVLVDAHVEADLSGMLWGSRSRYSKNPLELAKDLERACKEFHDFLRDHRSQDMVQLSVEKTIRNLCSACKDEWKTYKEDGKKFCANCGAEIEENNG
jgi:hypothetical protein